MGSQSIMFIGYPKQRFEKAQQRNIRHASFNLIYKTKYVHMTLRLEDSKTNNKLF